MSERREPTVSSVLSSKEELMDRRTRSKQQPRAARPAPSPRAVENQSSSSFLWFTFLVTLLVALLAGYTFWQLQTAQNTITQQSNRISQLESKLALSDDSASQSLTTVSAKIRELNKKATKAESEIDKLWAARNVNRKAIAAHDKSIKSLQKFENKVTALDKNIKGLEKTVAGIDKVKSSVNSLSQSVSDQDILLQSVREKVSTQGETLKIINTKVSQAATSAQVQSVDKRVKDNEEAVKSFDAFRRTVNRDLLQLKQGKQ